MQFISRLMDYYLTADNKKINILGATSGDTGSAAIYGFESIQSSNVSFFSTQPNLTYTKGSL